MQKSPSTTSGDLIRVTLSFLTKRQREVYLLYLKGLKTKEIAEKLGVEKSAVKKVHCRAKKRIAAAKKIYKIAKEM